MYLHVIEDPTRYNGWTNQQTFSVGSLILNDEGLYNSACRYERGTAFPSWHSFIDCRGLEDPNNVPLNLTRRHQLPGSLATSIQGVRF